MLSTEESQGKRAKGTSWTDDDNLLKTAFGRMRECVHGGNVLFQCQPCSGNRNQTSHNNDTFTRWPIRYQLDELSLGNLCVYVANSAREGVGQKWTWHDTFQNYDADYGWCESEHTQLGEMTLACHRMGRCDDVRGRFGVSFLLERFPHYQAGGAKPNLLFVFTEIGLLY